MAEDAVHDEVLGKLTWNSDFDWWEGDVDLSPNHSISISLTVDSGDEKSDIDSLIRHGRRIVAFIREHEPEARLVAAEELLDIYNQEWNDGKPLTEQEFIDRLTLDDINIAADGNAELFYKDDDLFAGHTVLVTVDAAGNFADADVAG